MLMLSSYEALGRRLIGRPVERRWTLNFEIGTLFYRRQFKHALSLPDMTQARAYFDSLQMMLGDSSEVEVQASAAGEPRGEWFLPRQLRSAQTLLYFHGGGYAFYAGVTRHFIAMLAQWLGLRVFALDYRLTPEHAHPAQIDDALAAYRWLLERGVAPADLVLGGDSAGGHLALMCLARLKAEALPQPALCLALSPWTDIGRRGASQFGNDRYDLVQGDQTLLYGGWLRGGSGLDDAALSPIGQDFRGTAPIYLQAGGKEILVDMIRDFAETLRRQDAAVRLDVWPLMNHEFHAYGDTLPESREAITCLRQAIAWARAAPAGQPFPCHAGTELDTLSTHEPRAGKT